MAQVEARLNGFGPLFSLNKLLPIPTRGRLVIFDSDKSIVGVMRHFMR